VSSLVKTIVYIVFLGALYVSEHDVPVMLYYRRIVFLANWKFSAWTQRQALDSYTSYMEEAEYTRG
jgi:hypothetical protein